jgi:hypothetical protein
LLNKQIADLNYTIFGNDGIQTLAFSATVQTFAVFTKLLVYFTFRIPDSKEDKNFAKEGMKIVFDAERAFSGLQKNFLVSKIVDMVLKGSEQEIKFPLKKVSLNRYHLEPSQ